jgi:TFIIF-interacting CTD phosphatase-like protein
MVGLLDPKREHIAGVLSRQHCIDREQVYLKDIRLINGRNPADIVLVDNCIVCFSRQLDNAIYVPSFVGSSKDHELQTVLTFLQQIADMSDLRPYVRQFAGLVLLHALYLQALPTLPRPTLQLPLTTDT